MQNCNTPLYPYNEPMQICNTPLYPYNEPIQICNTSLYPYNEPMQNCSISLYPYNGMFHQLSGEKIRVKHLNSRHCWTLRLLLMLPGLREILKSQEVYAR